MVGVNDLMGQVLWNRAFLEEQVLNISTNQYERHLTRGKLNVYL